MVGFRELALGRQVLAPRGGSNARMTEDVDGLSGQKRAQLEYLVDVGRGSRLEVQTFSQRG